jgi:hypothetical protein
MDFYKEDPMAYLLTILKALLLFTGSLAPTWAHARGSVPAH